MLRKEVCRPGFPGYTVEGRGVIWAEKAKERMLTGKEPVILIKRVTEEYNRLGKLPSLSGGKNPADVRFDPFSGKIYYTTWREKETSVEDGRRFLKPPKGKQSPEYEILSPPSRRRSPWYLEDLPHNVPVQELLIRHADTIEEAILKVKNILQAGIGEQAQRVIGQITNLAIRFIEKGLSKESLLELAQQTGQFLEEAGLVKPNSPDFQKAMKRLRKACEPDSRGRINSLVSRTLVQSVYVWAMKRVIVGSLVSQKHGENFYVLVNERETTRRAIQNAVEQLEVFSGHVAFRQPEKEVKLQQAEAMGKILEKITYGWGNLVRVAPYLVPARVAAIKLVGCREEKKESNRKILGETIADELFTLKPTTQLLSEGSFTKALFEIKIMRDILDKVLEDNAAVGS